MSQAPAMTKRASFRLFIILFGVLATLLSFTGAVYQLWPGLGFRELPMIMFGVASYLAFDGALLAAAIGCDRLANDFSQVGKNLPDYLIIVFFWLLMAIMLFAMAFGSSMPYLLATHGLGKLGPWLAATVIIAFVSLFASLGPVFGGHK